MNPYIAPPPVRRVASRFAVAVGLVALLAALSVGTSPIAAMSADGSSYAVVLPWVTDSSFFRTRIAVENHSSSTIALNAHWVGDDRSAMPGQRPCSDAGANPVPQTFSFAVDGDEVRVFDLGALLAEKCRGPVAGTNRGTLTILTPAGAGQALISATARVDRVSGPGATALGYTLHGIPLGALEGSELLVAGLRSGKFASADYRVDCLVSSFADASRSGDVYTLRVKDAAGRVLGDRVFALKPWSSRFFEDVTAMVGAPGPSYDGLQVEVEPGANPTPPSMVASCRTLSRVDGVTALAVGKVYEPKDRQLQRTVSVGATPGWGTFSFDPQRGKALHVLFLRHPDMLSCVVDHPQLTLTLADPSGLVVQSGFQSIPELFTGFRSEANFGDAGAWGLTVRADPMNPPTSSVDYTLRCVSGNGISQLDRMP
jgi:hypothetical protein